MHFGRSALAPILFNTSEDAMDARTFIEDQLATVGWAPISYDLANFLRKRAGSPLDFAGLANNLDVLAGQFARTKVCTARVDGFGDVPILYRSQIVLAERIAFLTGGNVKIVTTGQARQLVQREPETSDVMALLYAEVETKEAPRPCRQCGNLREGNCRAAQDGKLDGAPMEYKPDPLWPRLCRAYAPPPFNHDEAIPSNYDRRTGCELWPELVE
jgi:hypothetical protein